MRCIYFLVALLVVAFVQEGIAASLPQTGQTECFNAAGASVLCAECPECAGQDGALKVGIPLPSPRFSVKDGLLTDLLTGLMWPENANLMAGRDFDFDKTEPIGSVSWDQALAYVNKLNNEKFGGFNDWRLPSANELETLMHQTTTDFTNSAYLWQGGEGVGNIQNWFYWSSTVLAGTSQPGVWVASLATGAMTHFSAGVDSSAYVFPVRGGRSETVAFSILQTGQEDCFDAEGCAGVSWDISRFTRTADVVKDALTGLEWIAEPMNLVSTGCGVALVMTWDEALSLISCLNSKMYAEKSDWRLPNRKEILSVVWNGREDNFLFLESVRFAFPDGSPQTYWTSSSYLKDPRNAWSVSLKNGGATVQPTLQKYVTAGAWPVRGRLGTAIPVVDRTSIDFQAVETGEVSAPFVVTVSNAKDAGNVLVVNPITVSDTTSFIVEPGGDSPCSSLSPVLPPGDSCTLHIFFHPATPGEKVGELLVPFSGGLETQVVALSGKGQDTRLWVALDGDRRSFLTRATTQSIRGTYDAGATVWVKVAGRKELKADQHSGAWSFAVHYLVPGTTDVLIWATDVSGNQTEPFVVKVTYQPFQITPIVATEGGIITPVDPIPPTPADPVPVPYRGKASFAITPSFGFYVDKVRLDNGKNVGRRTSYTFTNVRSDRSITAWFARKVFSVKTAASKGGAITKSFKSRFEETPSITVVPKAGYEVLKVTDKVGVLEVVLYDADGNQGVLEPDGSFIHRFDPISDHHKIRGTFRKLPAPSVQN